MKKNFNARGLHKLVVGDPQQINFFERNSFEKEFSSADDLNIVLERYELSKSFLDPASTIAIYRKYLRRPPYIRKYIP